MIDCDDDMLTQGILAYVTAGSVLPFVPIPCVEGNSGAKGFVRWRTSFEAFACPGVELVLKRIQKILVLEGVRLYPIPLVLCQGVSDIDSCLVEGYYSMRTSKKMVGMGLKDR